MRCSPDAQVWRQWRIPMKCLSDRLLPRAACSQQFQADCDLLCYCWESVALYVLLGTFILKLAEWVGRNSLLLLWLKTRGDQGVSVCQEATGSLRWNYNITWGRELRDFPHSPPAQTSASKIRPLMHVIFLVIYSSFWGSLLSCSPGWPWTQHPPSSTPKCWDHRYTTLCQDIILKILKTTSDLHI